MLRWSNEAQASITARIQWSAKCIEEISGLGEIGPYPQGLFERLCGFGAASLLCQDGGAGVGDAGIVRVGLLSLDERIERGIGEASLVASQAEIVPGLGVVRIDGHGVFQGAKGLVEATDFIPCEGQTEVKLGGVGFQARSFLHVQEGFLMLTREAEDDCEFVVQSR